MKKKTSLVILLLGCILMVTGCGKQDYGNTASVVIAEESNEIPQLPFLDGTYPFKWNESITNMEKLLNCKLEKRGEFYHPSNETDKQKGYYFDDKGELLAVIIYNVPQDDLKKIGGALAQKYSIKPKKDFYYARFGKGKVKFSLDDSKGRISVEKVE